MFFRWLLGNSESTNDRPRASATLMELVRGSMPAAGPQDAAIVCAVAGLFAFVAYADRRYSEEEKQAVRTALQRFHVLPDQGIDAVCTLLETQIAELAHESLNTYTRVLYELSDRDARLEVLDVLMDVATADDVLSMDETNGLRRIANLLGLSEADYLAAQAKHKDRLSVLR
ncbi:MAG TPA: TerB family tellurite resistance protein [Polyangiales bacterium]|nr:TerB family tellurite resistance protein [Polyangiales bacterium]